MPDKEKKYGVGGQALMEGVMMNGPKGVAMALRLPDGSIETQLKKVTFLRDKHKILALPFIRGPINFVEQMIFGYKCLMESAEKTSIDFDEVDEEEQLSKVDKWLTDHFGPKMMAVIGIISAILGFVIAAFLFMWLPAKVVNIIDTYLCSGNLNNWRPAIEGLIRVVIFIAYMAAVSLMKDIKRLFMYHGAEHKSIFCYEHDLPLTIENVKKQKRFHPRCGTSFIFVIIVISIIVSSLLVIIAPNLRNNMAVWMCVKFLILPVVMSIGYECIRFVGKHDNLFTRVLAAPGLWMQRITTNEPTDDIIEVGIASLKTALGWPVDNEEDEHEIVIMPEEIDSNDEPLHESCKEEFPQEVVNNELHDLSSEDENLSSDSGEELK